jgi:TonB family protein
MRKSTGLSWLLVGASWCFAVEPARAEPTPSAPAEVAAGATEPTLLAPRLVSDSLPRYPAEALRAQLRDVVGVTVVLELDAGGRVQGTKIERPQGLGFDEAAVDAARHLVFEPARRGGVAVASRIAFRFSFRPPPTRLVGRALVLATEQPVSDAVVVVTDADGAAHPAPVDAAGRWRLDGLPPGPVRVTVSGPGLVTAESTADLEGGAETTVLTRLSPPAPGPTSAAQAGEIVVRGERPPREVSKRTLTKDEIAHLPGTMGDALRSIQSLPGVARPPPFSGQLVVRGSAPQDTTVFVEGVDVPLVYHFGGLSSVVPTDLLEKIDFYPANYSAVFGRGMGGMVDVRLRSPRGDGVHGMAQVDFIDARALVEGPIGRTGVTFLVAARRSYFDLWLRSLLEESAGPVTTAPRYHDFQALLEKELGSRSSLRFSVFGSDDALQIVNQSPNASAPTFAGRVGAHTRFWRTQLRYEGRFGEHTRVSLMGAYGHDSVDVGLGPNFFTFQQRAINSRLELSQQLARGVKANVGVDLVVAPFDITLRLAPPRRPGETTGGPFDVPQQTHLLGSRTLPAFYLESEILPVAGMRLVPSLRADYTSTTRSWDVAPRLTARHDLVRAFPRTTLKGGAGLFFQPPTPLDTDPQFGQRGLRTSRAAHYDVGFEQDLSRHLRVSTDLFYKALDRLVVPGGGNGGSGRVYGAEWFLKYGGDPRFFGWIAYTLSRSERQDAAGGERYLFPFDQTHILTLVGSYQLGRGWQVGSRFRLVSGGLYTPESQGVFDATAGVERSASAIPRFSARLPAFQQLDLRIDKTWSFREGKLALYLDIQNVYYRKNPEGISYNYDFTRATFVNGLPILPSLGLRGEL